MSRNYPRREKTGSVWSVVVVFIVLGIFSLVAGYLGGQYLLRGITGQPDDAPEEEDDLADETNETEEEAPAHGEEMLDWSGISQEVFRIQVGAFSELGAAETKAARMRDEGETAAVISGDGEMFRVLVDVVGARESAEPIIDRVETDEREAVALAWSADLPPRELEVPAESADEIGDLLLCLEELVQMQADRDFADDPAAVRDLADRYIDLWEKVGAPLESACPDLHALLEDYVTPNARELKEDPGSSYARQTYIELLGAIRALGADRAEGG